MKRRSFIRLFAVGVATCHALAWTRLSELSRTQIPEPEKYDLRVSSLEETLRGITYKIDHIKLWKRDPKVFTYNTVEEHNLIESIAPPKTANRVLWRNYPTNKPKMV